MFALSNRIFRQEGRNKAGNWNGIEIWEIANIALAEDRLDGTEK